MSLTKEKSPCEEIVNTTDEDISVSNDLRKNRLSQNIEIGTAAQALRIRRDYLIALEDGNLKGLPERVYTLGFVRAYARYLGLDIDTTLQRFKAEVLGDPSSPTYTLPKPFNENTKPHRWVIFLSALLGLLILGGWFFFFNGPPVKHLTPPVPLKIKQELKGLADPSNAPPLKEDSQHPRTSQAPLPEEKEPYEAPVKEMTSLSADSSSLPDATLSEVAATTSQHTMVEPAEHKEKAPAPSATPPSITFTQPSWVEIKDAHGRLVGRRVFQAGEPFPSYPYDTELTIGNAGGVQLFKEGKRTFLGKQDEVVKGVKIPAKR